jgi:hypothetical protein
MSEKNRILELPVEDFTKLQYKLCEIEDQLLGMGAEPEKNYSLTDLIALHKSENLSEQLSYLCQRIDSLNGKLRTLNEHIDPSTQWI